MNRENILKVADAIEQHSIPDLGFNMSDVVFTYSHGHFDKSGHDCNTVACIAGWAKAASLGHKPGNDTRIDDVEIWLGIDDVQAAELFMPDDWEYGGYTPAQAVRTLRHLAETGEVRWDLAMAEAAP